MKAGFACGSMVLFFFFTKNVAQSATFFVKKHGIFRPAGGEICFRVSDRVTRVM
jgi:hypothetical protein